MARLKLSRCLRRKFEFLSGLLAPPRDIAGNVLRVSSERVSRARGATSVRRMMLADLRDKMRFGLLVLYVFPCTVQCYSQSKRAQSVLRPQVPDLESVRRYYFL